MHILILLVEIEHILREKAEPNQETSRNMNDNPDAEIWWFFAIPIMSNCSVDPSD
jgi:hypothetical protein